LDTTELAITITANADTCDWPVANEETTRSFN